MTDVIIQPPSDDIEEDTYSIIPILFVPPRMLTRSRIAPLLAMTGEISMRIILDPETDELSIGIGIPEDVFDAATDSDLMDVINLFRGLEDDAYHTRLLAIYKRSLN